MKGKRKFKVLFAAILLIVLLLPLLAWGNTALQVTEITVQTDKIPQSFSGYRIAQISDLHNATFGKDNERLVTELKNTRPDIIVLTGDLIDSNRTDLDVAVSFAQQAAQIAPTYFVTGNHEALISSYDQLETQLEKAGVTVLRNEQVNLTKGEETITLIGLDDPGFTATEETLELIPQTITDTLMTFTKESAGYTIVLAHRPEYIDAYAAAGVDLVLSGHAHGGQIRLPLIGGLVAPGQGLFPSYDAGLYIGGDTQMVVSRGLGNSVIPIRINNRPELVLVQLAS